MKRLIILTLLIATVTNLDAQTLKNPTDKNRERYNILAEKSDNALYAKDYKKMRKIDKKIIRLVTPYDAGFIYVRYGLALEEEGNVNGAIKVYKRAIKRYSSSEWGYSCLGYHYYRLGVAAIANSNELPTEQYNAGREKAKEYFRQAMPLLEKKSDIYKSLGILKHRDLLEHLRNIYYTLEMNDKFEEIEKLLDEW